MWSDVGRLPRRARRAVHARRGLRHLRLLHRGRERRGRCSLRVSDAVEDDNTLVTGVVGDTHAIAFFGYAYFVEESGQAQGGRGRRRQRLRRPDARDHQRRHVRKPLSRPLFIYPNVGEAKTRPELKAFVDFYLAGAGDFAAEVGYIAEPDALLAAEVAEWEAAVGG